MSIDKRLTVLPEPPTGTEPPKVFKTKANSLFYDLRKAIADLNELIPQLNAAIDHINQVKTDVDTTKADILARRG